MPYRIEKKTGKRPYKIINKNTGKVVGSSTSKSNAQASINARLAAEHGAKLTGKKRRK